MKIYHWAVGLALLGGVILECSLGEETAVVTQKNVNVRGQPSLYSEVIAHLKQGDKVTVLEEVTPEKPKPGDPEKWARIKLPEDTHVWVFAPYVKDNAISVPKLNLRGGPGENFSVLGRMQKGESIKPIRTLQDWIEIEATTNSSAFIAFEVIKLVPAEPTGTNVVEGAAAGLAAPAVLPIKNQPAKTEPANKQVEQQNPPLATASVTNTTVVTTNAFAPAIPVAQKIEARKVETQDSQTKPRDNSKTLSTKVVADDTAPALPNDVRRVPDVKTPSETFQAAAAVPVESRIVTKNPAQASTTPDLKPKDIGDIPSPTKVPEETFVKRIVRREGIVRNALSIQAPTPFELVNPQTHQPMDYLHGEKSGVTVKHFKGQRVIVTGEEGIDPRWPNTPVLEIETIDSAP
jgi:uncharacterized protein YgiM (DUF1202 family)